MKSKKGAIELSMTTIIVIVLGITLLTLGLTWIRSSLGDVMDLTDRAFKMSDQEIEGMFSNSNDLLKIVPSTAEIKKGDSAQVAVIFYNLEGGTMDFQAKVTPVAAGVPLICKFDTETDTSDRFTLQSGSHAIMKLRAETTQQTTLGYGGCKVEMITPGVAQTGYQLQKTYSIEVIG